MLKWDLERNLIESVLSTGSLMNRSPKAEMRKHYRNSFYRLVGKLRDTDPLAYLCIKKTNGQAVKLMWRDKEYSIGHRNIEEVIKEQEEQIRSFSEAPKSNRDTTDVEQQVYPDDPHREAPPVAEDTSGGESLRALLRKMQGGKK